MTPCGKSEGMYIRRGFRVGFPNMATIGTRPIIYTGCPTCGDQVRFTGDVEIEDLGPDMLGAMAEEGAKSWVTFRTVRSAPHNHFCRGRRSEREEP